MEKAERGHGTPGKKEVDGRVGFFSGNENEIHRIALYALSEK